MLDYISVCFFVLLFKFLSLIEGLFLSSILFIVDFLIPNLLLKELKVFLLRSFYSINWSSPCVFKTLLLKLDYRSLFLCFIFPSVRLLSIFWWISSYSWEGWEGSGVSGLEIGSIYTCPFVCPLLCLVLLSFLLFFN